MNMQEHLRTHHITNFKPFETEVDVEEIAWLSARVRYKLGSLEERELFHNTLIKVWKAVVNGNYIDIGENPDILCDKCLNPFCPDSYMTRTNNSGEILFRQQVNEIVSDECAVLVEPEDLHEFMCQTIDWVIQEQKAKLREQI